jgi:hypothetical protein
MRLNARYLSSSDDDNSDFEDQDVVGELMHAFHSDNDSVVEADSGKEGEGGGGVLSFRDVSFHESDAASSEASSGADTEDESEDAGDGDSDSDELRLASGVPGSVGVDGAAAEVSAGGEKKKKKKKKRKTGNRHRTYSGHGGGSGASSPRKNRSRANSADTDVRAGSKNAKPAKGSVKAKLFTSFKLAVSAVKVQKPVRKPVTKRSGVYEGPRRRTIVMPDAMAATVTAPAPALAFTPVPTPVITTGTSATDLCSDAGAVALAPAVSGGVGGGASRKRASFMGNVSLVGSSAAAPVEAPPVDGHKRSFLAPRGGVAGPSGGGGPHALAKQLSGGRAGLVVKPAPVGRKTVTTRAMVINAAKLMSELGLEKVEDDEDGDGYEDEGVEASTSDKNDGVGDVEDLEFSDDEASAASLALSFASASEEDAYEDQDVEE